MKTNKEFQEVQRVSIVNPKQPVRIDSYGNKQPLYIVGFAWVASEVSYFVKTIYGIIEVLKEDINTFFETKIINSNQIKQWQKN